MKDLKLLFKKRFSLRRMSFRDYVVNIYLKYRFLFIRKFVYNRIKNYSPVNKEGYELTFYDNFSHNTWNDDKWTIGGSNRHYTAHIPTNHYVAPELIDGGGAKFIARYNPQTFDNREFPYEASKITTQKTFRQKYGRFECRMTLPEGRGIWPAFWLWGPTWPPEIDVIEAYGLTKGNKTNIQHISLHWGGRRPDNKNLKGWLINIQSRKTLGEVFHEFVVEWSPKKIKFITNGIKVFEFTNKEILDKWFNSIDEEKDGGMWITLNTNIHPDHFKEVDSNYYSEFKVDYVRAYQFKKK